MLFALGFAGVFCAPPSARCCAEPIVVSQGAFEREARLADGCERDYLPFAGLSSECARELALSDKILEYGLRFPSGAK